MSEKEIIEALTNYDLSNHFNNNKFFEAINRLLFLYNKEKEKNRELQVIVDDIKNGVYIDYPEFEDKYISKDKIRTLIKETAYPDTYNFKTISVSKLEKLLEE